MQRRAEFRPFSWIHDLWKRDQLDLNPPYQRRSVWSDRFKSDFITTVLLNYPCPAVFLYEEIRPDGSFIYKVVDGKQRLTTLFDFVSDRIAVSDEYPSMSLRGLSFSSLDDATKLRFWRYAFSVEFIEQENESVINDIFNRLNKNVAKLTPQELRHARLAGRFISAAEQLAEEMEASLPPRFPNITPQSKRQMKDVENAATMLLFIEQGERSLSQADLDEAFSKREEEWPEQAESQEKFRKSISFIKQVLDEPNGDQIRSSRLKNQADFYSLFAATIELQRGQDIVPPQIAAKLLISWLDRMRDVDNSHTEANRAPEIALYLNAARAASNDAGPRRTRINAIKTVLLGQ